MMNKKLLTIGMFVSLLLTACGFQLRGTATPLPVLFAKTYVSSNTQDARLVHRLKDLLIVSNSELVERDKANAWVQISELKTFSRQIAKSDNNALKEYERTFSTTVTVVDAKTQAQLGSRELFVTQNIQLNDNQVLAGEEQSRITQHRAETALAQAIIRYLKTF